MQKLNNKIINYIIIYILSILLELQKSSNKIKTEIINTMNIFTISGTVFQEIKYTTIIELNEKLINLLVLYDADIHVQLLINENDLNNFSSINTNVLSNITENDFITIIFSNKKELYCLSNENGKYILDNKNDNYSKLLKLVISDNKKNSYNIIKKNHTKNFYY